jgi:hypothetical protein
VPKVDRPGFLTKYLRAGGLLLLLLVGTAVTAATRSKIAIPTKNERRHRYRCTCDDADRGTTAEINSRRDEDRSFASCAETH